MIAFESVDYLAQARERYTDYFKDDPFYDAFLKGVLTLINELQECLKGLLQLRSLDTATGEQLDVIGALVGQPRVLANFTAIPYFGFDGASGAQSYGSIADPLLGGVFRSINQPEGVDYAVDDETYRFLIRARIMANSSTCTSEAVISSIKFVTGRNDVQIAEPGNAHIIMYIPDVLTDLQKYFLSGVSSLGSIIPVPIGVSVTIIYVNSNYFGMAEDAASNTLGDLTDASVGGYLTSL